VSYLVRDLLNDEANVMAATRDGSSGTITVQTEVPRPLSIPVLKSVVVDHQVDVPLTPKLNVFGGAYIMNRQKLGFGMGYFGARCKVDKGTSVSGSYVLGYKQKLTVETSREFSRNTHVRCAVAFPRKGSPELKLSSSHQLGSGLIGEADLGLGGGEEALGFGFTLIRGKSEFIGKLKLAESEICLAGTYKHRYVIWGVQQWE
jgi:hypothetical protein